MDIDVKEVSSPDRVKCNNFRRSIETYSEFTFDFGGDTCGSIAFLQDVVLKLVNQGKKVTLKNIVELDITILHKLEKEGGGTGEN